MSKTAPSPPAKRSRRGNLLLILVFAALVLVLLVLMVFHRPAFYADPASRDRGALLRGALSFTGKAQDFVSAIISDEEFPLEITEDEVNGYLAAVNDKALYARLPVRLESWRQAFTSDALRDVEVAFSPGKVTVGGETTWLGRTVVVSVTGAPYVDAEGRARLSVSCVWAGALPLPKFLFGKLLRNIDDRPIPSSETKWKVTCVEIRDGSARLEGGPQKRK